MDLFAGMRSEFFRASIYLKKKASKQALCYVRSKQVTVLKLSPASSGLGTDQVYGPIEVGG